MTKYQFTDEHMRTVSTLSDNFLVQASRRAHWDEWIKAHDDALLKPILELHTPLKVWESDRQYTLVCGECKLRYYPCPTVKLITGSQDD